MNAIEITPTTKGFDLESNTPVTVTVKKQGELPKVISGCKIKYKAPLLSVFKEKEDFVFVYCCDALTHRVTVTL